MEPDELIGLAQRQVVTFEIGEQVRVADGPFATFNGYVEDVERELDALLPAESEPVSTLVLDRLRSVVAAPPGVDRLSHSPRSSLIAARTRSPSTPTSSASGPTT